MNEWRVLVIVKAPPSSGLADVQDRLEGVEYFRPDGTLVGVIKSAVVVQREDA